VINANCSNIINATACKFHVHAPRDTTLYNISEKKLARSHLAYICLSEHLLVNARTTATASVTVIKFIFVCLVNFPYIVIVTSTRRYYHASLFVHYSFLMLVVIRQLAGVSVREGLLLRVLIFEIRNLMLFTKTNPTPRAKHKMMPINFKVVYRFFDNFSRNF